MKNLLIYISPDHKFLPEYEKLVRIQIDNSLALGWKKEDMMLVQNFPFEYNGVKAIEVGDENICPFYMYSGKINTFVDMWKQGLVEKDTTYWYHDYDAFQNEVITEEELELDKEIGMTDYGRKPNWNGGSTFFKYGCLDIFEKMQKHIYRHKNPKPIEDHIEAYLKYSDEVAIKHLTDTDEEINARIKRMNIKYNFNLRYINAMYEQAERQIKVVHFHKDRMYSNHTSGMDIALGRNELERPLVHERLITLFNKYGYA